MDEIMGPPRRPAGADPSFGYFNNLESNIPTTKNDEKSLETDLFGFFAGE